MSSLAEELPKEQARVRALMQLYKEIGPSGAFAIAMMERSLADADEAAARGDVVAMMQSLEDLRGYND